MKVGAKKPVQAIIFERSCDVIDALYVGTNMVVDRKNTRKLYEAKLNQLNKK